MANTADAVWPHKKAEPYSTTIYRFLKKAHAEVKPLGVNISANVFGLAANRDLDIGQNVPKIAPLLDVISPMAYPSHYGAGEYNLSDPNDEPGATVSFTMGDFRAALGSSKTEIRPWLQDFSLRRPDLHDRGRGEADHRGRARRRQGLAALERRRRVPHERARLLAGDRPPGGARLPW